MFFGLLLTTVDVPPHNGSKAHSKVTYRQQAKAVAGHVVIPPQLPSDRDKNEAYSLHTGNYSS